MSDAIPTDEEAREYVRMACRFARGDGGSGLLGGRPDSHAEEKSRWAGVVLQALGVREPAPRPLWQVRGTAPAHRPDVVLNITAGPSYFMLFSPADLQTFESFANAIASQSDMPAASLSLEVFLTYGQTPEAAWTEVAEALDWLALNETDWNVLSNRPGGFSVGPSDRA